MGAKDAEREFRSDFTTSQENIRLRDNLHAFLHDPKRRGGLFEYLGIDASEEEISLLVEAADLCLKQNWVPGLKLGTKDQKDAFDFLIRKAGERKREPRVV